MKIAFYSPHLCLRGTTVAMYDYAFYNQALLGNESCIIYSHQDHRNSDSAIEKFKDSFKEIHPIKNERCLDEALTKSKADAVYILKAGKNDERQSSVCKNLIHCTGVENQPHGHVYAYVSNWLSEECSKGKLPVVPHIVDLPPEDKDLRSELGIPDSSVVFGRNGGMDTWSLPFVNSVISETLERRSDIYFIFQNTEKFINHPRVLFIESTAHMYYKTKFINTCDGMIHARLEGESFGLSCGEFSIRNKPVITWSGSNEKNHIKILGEKAFLYNNAADLLSIFLDFTKQPEKDWNCYREFSPKNVMKKFDQIFLN